jgi:hypothetical protein
MGEVIAFYDAGADISVIFTGTGGTVGGRFVGVPAAPDAGGSAGISDSGTGLTKVGFPTDLGWSLGVTAHDVVENGIVNIMRAPKVVPVECSAAVAAGEQVSAGTDGRCKPWAAGADNFPLGRNIGAATTTAGQFAKVLLFNAGATKNA